MRAYRTGFVLKMLPSGPLVMVIVPGGADLTKTITAPASTRTAKRIAAMVMARLRPNISMIIVSRLGLAVARPPALSGPVKSSDCLSLLIAWQRRLRNQLEQGEKPCPNKRSRRVQPALLTPTARSDVLVVAEEMVHCQLMPGLDGLLQPPSLVGGHGRKCAGEGGVGIDMVEVGHANARKADGQGEGVV